MKRKCRNTVLIVIILLLTAAGAAADEREEDLGLGFFSGYNEQRHTVTIFASYNEWEFEIEGMDPEQLKRIYPGSLVEFSFYPEGSGYTVTDIADYGVPSPKEYEKIVAEYQLKREALREEQPEEKPEKN